MSFWDFIADIESDRLTTIAIVAGLLVASTVTVIAVAVHRFTRLTRKQRRDLVKLIGLLVKGLRG